MVDPEPSNPERSTSHEMQKRLSAAASALSYMRDAAALAAPGGPSVSAAALSPGGPYHS